MGMHSYWRQVFFLPQSVIKAVNDLCRKFRWGWEEDTTNCMVYLLLVNKGRRARSEGQKKMECSSSRQASIAHCYNAGLIKRLRWIQHCYIRRSNRWDCIVKNDSSWYWRRLLKVREQVTRMFLDKKNGWLAGQTYKRACSRTRALLNGTLFRQ